LHSSQDLAVDENRLTGEPRLLPDGQGIYIHTFNCGLYLLRGVDRPEPTVSFVRTFEGKECGVPILTGRYWLQTVPDAHALIALDIENPEHPREVSRVTVGDDERPHWIEIDPTGRRVVLNSGGYSKGNRLFLINFDPVSGKLSIDEQFRDADLRAGINLTGKTWPHGFAGKAAPPRNSLLAVTRGTDRLQANGWSRPLRSAKPQPQAVSSIKLPFEL
jgi:hypothetical protein